MLLVRKNCPQLVTIFSFVMSFVREGDTQGRDQGQDLTKREQDAEPGLSRADMSTPGEMMRGYNLPFIFT